MLAVPAAAMPLKPSGEFLFGSATGSSKVNWRLWVPAGLLVGSLALLVEKGLYRFAGTWPTSWPLYLVRAVVLGTIYVALVVDIGFNFSYRSIATISLPDVWPLFRDFWLLLVMSVPFGLLLGVAQTVLLRPRDPDTLAAAVGLGMLALLVVALSVREW